MVFSGEWFFGVFFKQDFFLEWCNAFFFHEKKGCFYSLIGFLVYNGLQECCEGAGNT